MTTKIQYNYKGLEQAMLTGSGIERVEREVMEQKLSEIQGQFIVDFGFTGKSNLERLNLENTVRRAQSSRLWRQMLKLGQCLNNILDG